ncbi:hypothetical protein E4K64_14755 [Bradyrhizobium frederickii]|uniref:Uncharacterized protein n=1 Tax=Bradyrhizobium frederickii TaxID=2560054 RepID=A0A4Y9PAY7_9BRAD|nr:hypothetical protein [Bradyrhizobium frederickii]TFV75843.1 hypothetical protein E4K64_14755 [Bradyrhizobium frederickii]
MIDPKSAGLTLKQLADLHHMTAEELLNILNDPAPKAIGFSGRYNFADALEIEIARQMSDKAGVPLNEAFRLSMYTMAVQSFLSHRSVTSGSLVDFWFAVAASRNTWGSAPRGMWPVTGFGAREYWAEMHYTGSLVVIMEEITQSIGRDQAHYPDSDPARIVMCNISAADRRLRKRAAELVIELDCAPSIP